MTPSGLNLRTLADTPFGWPLQQLGIPPAHRVTRGSPDVVVAVIDLGYCADPDHIGHLWSEERSGGSKIHGWDCADDDTSLEYSSHDPDLTYHKSHHTFVVGEVIACAPECRVMVVRAGYDNPDSWWRAVDYAVAHGAKILVIPHAYLTHGDDSSVPLFYRGCDFSYASDNPQMRRALEEAYDAGCLIFKGTADNRGRRVALDEAAFECVVAVGSTNRKGAPSDMCGSSDYVEIAAPAGERASDDPLDKVWSTGGDGSFIPFTGGCMASGFAGGAAALIWSHFPQCTNEQIRQILRNVAADLWTPQLGWGVPRIDKAVQLKPEQLAQRLALSPDSCRFIEEAGRFKLRLTLENQGAFDVQRAMVVAYDGDPTVPAAPQGTFQNAVELLTRQVGHSVVPVRGLHEHSVDIALSPDFVLPENRKISLWLQFYSLDRHGANTAITIRVTPAFVDNNTGAR